MTAVDASDPEPESRSSRKRRVILEAATAVFLDNGYVGTSMDEIATVASVSKQTVYKHFEDKETLFSELITSIVAEASDPVQAVVQELPESGDIESDLRDLARRQLALVMTPEIMRLRRLVIGEAGRFPELSRTFYELGPQRTIEALSGVFAQLNDRGALRIDDPSLAAEHFNWLIMSTPLNRAMFLPEEAPSAAELQQSADAGVAAFLSAYGY